MQVIGEVIAVNGNVRAVMGSEERVLTQGYPIHQGETILTGQGGSVEIKLADDSILAQGENATQTLDSFIFDPANASASSMLVDMAQGTFRMVTGQVGKANPEGVAVKTPLATIGIRGTGIDLDVQGAIAKVGCFLYDGLDVTITTEQGTRFLTAVNTILDILADGTFGEIRSYSDFERAFFSAAVPLLSVDTGTDDGDQQGEGEGGDDTGEGEGDAGEGEPGEGDTGEGDAGEGEVGTPEATLSMEALFEAIFGTPEQPNQALQELFQALTGDEGGNEANDSLAEGEGDDTLEGLGDGDDDDDDDSTLIGGGDDDTLPGGDEGDDTLPGDDEGDDTLPGDDEGDDTLPGDDEDDEDTTPTGGGGSASPTSYVQNGDSSGNSISGDQQQAGDNDQINGYEGDDSLFGLEGSDTVDGGTGSDSIEGNCGNDELHGGEDDDSIWGGNDNDFIYGEAGSDYLKGEDGNDAIWGGDDNDTIWGGAGNDTIDGGAGDDFITGGIGVDSLVGGLGSDTLNYTNTTEGGDIVYGFISAEDKLDFNNGDFQAATDGGHHPIAGSSFFGPTAVPGAYGDTVLEVGSSGSAGFVFDGNGDLWYDPDFGTTGDAVKIASIMDGLPLVAEDITISTTSWTGNEDGSTFDSSSADRVQNGDGASYDFFTGDMPVTDQTDVMRGYDGNDTLNGLGGNDTLFGGAGVDSLHGGSGNDLLIAGTGDDEAHGGDGNDSIHGGDGSDYLNGDAGVDAIYANGDTDILDGGDGADHLSGGAGNDYFLVTASMAQGDYYDDFHAAEDKLILDTNACSFSGGTQIVLGTNYFVSAYAYNGSTGFDDITATGHSLVLDANDDLYYDDNPDPASADAAQLIGHFTNGLPDADSFVVAGVYVGDGGGDYQSGTGDSDFMVGLENNDTLFGGGGSDTFYGGNDADAFKYTALSDGGVGGTTGDKIIDFHHGEDYFEFKSGIFAVCDTVIAGDDTVPKNTLGFWEWGGAYAYGFDGGGNYGDKGFIFDSNGDLWYDPNLGDVNDAVHIAHVEGEVTNEDIHLVP